MKNYKYMQASFWSVLFLWLAIPFASEAQNGWNWPEDKSAAQEKVVLYTDAQKQKNFEAALPPLEWLLANAPDLNPSIYINGADIYEELALKATDPAQKKTYIDSTLNMFDKRIEYFSTENKGNVLNRKANTAVKLMFKDKDEYDRLYDIFKSTAEASGDKLAYYNIVPYMNVAKVQYERGKLTEDQVIEIYDELSKVVDANTSGKNAAKYQDQGQNIDNIFASTITVSCDYIADKMVPKLEENPDDTDLAKKIIALSLASSCTDRPFFTQAAEVTFNKEPNAGLAKTIGNRKMANDDFAGAMEWYEKAISLSDDNAQKAEISMDMASMSLRDGKKAEARKYALEAANMDSQVADKAYKMVGDLYMNSYEQCKGGQDVVTDRAPFLAAYKMYQKAGDSAAAQRAKEQFPSKEEVFTYGKKVGDTMQVGCWIGESVTILTRD